MINDACHLAVRTCPSIVAASRPICPGRQRWQLYVPATIQRGD